jgi:hypothetical protein
MHHIEIGFIFSGIDMAVVAGHFPMKNRTFSIGDVIPMTLAEKLKINVADG